MPNLLPTRVVTGEIRLSYAHLFEARAASAGQDPKYSTTVLVPKTDTATKQRIDAAIAAAIDQGVAQKWSGVRPPVVSICVHDGDGARPSDGMPYGDECKGHWVFTAASKQPPQVIDLSGNPIIQQTDIYSGCYARVCVTFFAYSSNGKKGIGCALDAVQKLRDGEPLGGRVDAADVFADSIVPAAHAPAPTPAAQYAAYAPAQQAIDPITGRPAVGPVMGL